MRGPGIAPVARGRRYTPQSKSRCFSPVIATTGRADRGAMHETGDERVDRRSGCSALLSDRDGCPRPVVAAESSEIGSLAESAAWDDGANCRRDGRVARGAGRYSPGGPWPTTTWMDACPEACATRGVLEGAGARSHGPEHPEEVVVVCARLTSARLADWRFSLRKESINGRAILRESKRRSSARTAEGHCACSRRPLSLPAAALLMTSASHRRTA